MKTIIHDTERKRKNRDAEVKEVQEQSDHSIVDVYVIVNIPA
jgi:hypothetical protein